MSNANGITGSWDSGTGCSTPTMSWHQSQNTNTNDPNNGNRTVTWVVNDGDTHSGIANSPATIHCGGSATLQPTSTKGVSCCLAVNAIAEHLYWQTAFTHSGIDHVTINQQLNLLHHCRSERLDNIIEGGTPTLLHRPDIQTVGASQSTFHWQYQCRATFYP